MKKKCSHQCPDPKRCVHLRRAELRVKYTRQKVVEAEAECQRLRDEEEEWKRAEKTWRDNTENVALFVAKVDKILEMIEKNFADKDIFAQMFALKQVSSATDEQKRKFDEAIRKLEWTVFHARAEEKIDSVREQCRKGGFTDIWEMD